MTQSNEVVVRYPHLAGMLQDLEHRAEAALADPGEDIATQIMERILAAGDEAELFELQEAGTISGQDFIERPFTLHGDGIRWQKSNPGFVAAGAFPFYTLLTVQDAQTGETLTLNTGGKTLLTVLWKLESLHGFDPVNWPNGRPFMLLSHPTQVGYSWLSLKPLAMKMPEETRKNGRKAA